MGVSQKGNRSHGRGGGLRFAELGGVKDGGPAPPLAAVWREEPGLGGAIVSPLGPSFPPPLGCGAKSPRKVALMGLPRGWAWLVEPLRGFLGAVMGLGGTGPLRLVILLGLVQGALAVGDSGGPSNLGPMALAAASMWAGRTVRNSTRRDPPVESGDGDAGGGDGGGSDTEGYCTESSEDDDVCREPVGADDPEGGGPILLSEFAGDDMRVYSKGPNMVFSTLNVLRLSEDSIGILQQEEIWRAARSWEVDVAGLSDMGWESLSGPRGQYNMCSSSGRGASKARKWGGTSMGWAHGAGLKGHRGAPVNGTPEGGVCLGIHSNWRARVSGHIEIGRAHV